GQYEVRPVGGECRRRPIHGSERDRQAEFAELPPLALRRSPFAIRWAARRRPTTGAPSRRASAPESVRRRGRAPGIANAPHLAALRARALGWRGSAEGFAQDSARRPRW